MVVRIVSEFSTSTSPKVPNRRLNVFWVNGIYIESCLCTIENSFGMPIAWRSSSHEADIATTCRRSIYAGGRYRYQYDCYWSRNGERKGKLKANLIDKYLVNSYWLQKPCGPMDTTGR